MADTEKHVVTLTRNVDSTILNAFWDLVNIDDEIRLSAAENILVTLNKNQELYESEGMCPDLNYCVERLIKGLASSRKAARQGFTIVLTEVLKYDEVPLDLIFQLIEKHLPLTGSQLDTAPAVVGRTLAYGALVRSGRLKVDQEATKRTVVELRKLCSSRPYVEQVYSAVLIELFSQLNEEQFKHQVWPEIKEELTCGWNRCTPEQLFLLLVSLRFFPNAIPKTYLSTHWKNEDLIVPDCFDDIGKILKKSTSAHPLVHSVCNAVVKAALEGKHFTQFWKKVVNEMLLESGLDEKVYLGFQLIKIVLPQLTSVKKVEIVLSSAFYRTFMKAAFNKQHSLNQMALDMADFFSNFVKKSENSEIQFRILKLLILPPGSIFFDHITKKKTLTAIISDLHKEAVLQYTELMKKMFLDTEAEREEDLDDAEDPQRTYAVHQLASIVKHPAMIDQTDWQKSIVEFLLVHAFFDIKKESNKPQCSDKPVPLSTSLRRACQEAFYKALESWSQSKKPTTTKTRLQCEAETLNDIIDTATSLLNDNESVVSVVPCEEIIEHWNQMLRTVKILKKRTKKQGNLEESCAFQLLFHFLALQLLVDSTYPCGPLEELQECCKHALNLKSSSKMEDVEGSETDEPLWSEVLIDLMLSLLPNANHVMRSSLSLVFTFLIPHMTSKSLQQILEVINPFASVDDEEDGGGPLVEESDDSQEVKNVDEESNNDSSDDTSDMEVDEEEPVDEELKKKVKLALGAAADDEDDDSEVNLSDSEMMKLDDALTEAFKQHVSTKQKLSKQESSLQTFRLRCLDFIMVYLKSNPSLSGVIQITKPLLSAAEFGARRQFQQPLKAKAIHTLDLLLKCKKFENMHDVSKDTLIELLHYLMDKAKKATDLEVSSIVSKLCAWTVSMASKVKQSENTEELEGEWYLTMYKQTLDEHFTKSKIETHQFLFTSLMTTCPDTCMHFLKWIQKFLVDENIRVFKKTEALGLFSVALKSCKHSNSIKEEEWKEVLVNFFPQMIQLVIDGLKDPKGNRRYISDLLEVLFLMSDISQTLFKMHPLRSYPEVAKALKAFPRSKKRLLLKRSFHVLKKLIQMTSESTTESKTE